MKLTGSLSSEHHILRKLLEMMKNFPSSPTIYTPMVVYLASMGSLISYKLAGHGEEPEEESVEHHRDVFPILHDLIVFIIISDVLSNELDSLQRHLHLRAEPV